MASPMKACVRLVAAAAIAVAAVVSVSAQDGRAARQAQRQGAGPATGDEPAAVTPAEIQRMFDSYALMQAQEQLKISDEQFAQFLSRFKALQDVRRRGLQERARRLQELRRQLNSAAPDDGVIRDQMKGLQDLDAQQQADLKKAYDAIDQVLDLRQQAKFRVFEENMERRKLELITRARQANRPKL